MLSDIIVSNIVVFLTAATALRKRPRASVSEHDDVMTLVLNDIRVATIMIVSQFEHDDDDILFRYIEMIYVYCHIDTREDYMYEDL